MADTIEPIKITGLADFNRSLRRMSAELPKALRLAHNEGAQIVVDWVQPRVERRSGKAAKSVKAKSTRTESRVTGGNARTAPYYPWLDFGGDVGPDDSVHRKYYSDGRYLYPSLAANREGIENALERALLQVCREAGVEVD
jgi:hypothetical protein